jgi:hypothetical protein
MTPKLGSLFGGLFSDQQTAKDKEEYRLALELEKATREVASWNETEVGNELVSNQKEKGWIN